MSERMKASISKAMTRREQEEYTQPIMSQLARMGFNKWNDGFAISNGALREITPGDWYKLEEAFEEMEKYILNHNTRENAMSSSTEDKSFKDMFGLIVQKDKLTQEKPAARGDEWVHREGAATTSLGDKMIDALREVQS